MFNLGSAINPLPLVCHLDYKLQGKVKPEGKAWLPIFKPNNKKLTLLLSTRRESRLKLNFSLNIAQMFFNRSPTIARNPYWGKI